VVLQAVSVRQLEEEDEEDIHNIEKMSGYRLTVYLFFLYGCP